MVVLVSLVVVFGIRRAHRAMHLSIRAHIGRLMAVAAALASHGRRVGSRAIGVGRVLRIRALVAVRVVRGHHGQCVRRRHHHSTACVVPLRRVLTRRCCGQVGCLAPRCRMVEGASIARTPVGRERGGRWAGRQCQCMRQTTRRSPTVSLDSTGPVFH
jgi:hypothetical protein